MESLRETTHSVLAQLTPREAKVLRMRFGIDMNTDHTLEEVGKQFDVTRERIRQIEAKALRKLRHPSRVEQLRSFLIEDRALTAADRKRPRLLQEGAAFFFQGVPVRAGRSTLFEVRSQIHHDLQHHQQKKCRQRLPHQQDWPGAKNDRDMQQDHALIRLGHLLPDRPADVLATPEEIPEERNAVADDHREKRGPQRNEECRERRRCQWLRASTIPSHKHVIDEHEMDGHEGAVVNEEHGPVKITPQREMTAILSRGSTNHDVLRPEEHHELGDIPVEHQHPEHGHQVGGDEKYHREIFVARSGRTNQIRRAHRLYGGGFCRRHGRFNRLRQWSLDASSATVRSMALPSETGTPS